MPKQSPDPTTTRPAPNFGNGLAVGVWALLAFINVLAIVVGGAMWAAPIAIIAVGMAIVTYRQMRGRADAAGD